MRLRNISYNSVVFLVAPRCRPFHFAKFENMKDINNHSGTVLGLRQVSAESEQAQQDEHLGLALDVLMRLHSRFYPPGEDDKDGEVDTKSGERKA